MISEHSNLQYFVDDAGGVGATTAINISSVEFAIWEGLWPNPELHFVSIEIEK